MLLLVVSVYLFCSVLTYLVSYSIYPELFLMLGAYYQIFLFVMCTITTLPFGYLLLKVAMRLSETNSMLSHMSRTDFLTGIPNRGAFLSDARSNIGKAMGPGALLIIDADNFKAINDTYGHQTGDLALTVIARHLLASVREGDLVGRIGGEEFGVFLSNATLDQAETIAQRIRQKIADEPVGSHDGSVEFNFTVSVGGIHMNKSEAFDHCFKQADQLLYEAKRAGRNQVMLSSFVREPSLGVGTR